MEDLILVLDNEADLDLLLDSDSEWQFEIDDAVIRDYETYDGEYEINPILYDEQILQTRKRVMLDDLTIRPIPIVSITNPFGGQTVIIG